VDFKKNGLPPNLTIDFICFTGSIFFWLTFKCDSQPRKNTFLSIVKLSLQSENMYSNRKNFLVLGYVIFNKSHYLFPVLVVFSYACAHKGYQSNHFYHGKLTGNAGFNHRNGRKYFHKRNPLIRTSLFKKSNFRIEFRTFIFLIWTKYVYCVTATNFSSIIDFSIIISTSNRRWTSSW